MKCESVWDGVEGTVTYRLSLTIKLFLVQFLANRLVAKAWLTYLMVFSNFLTPGRMEVRRKRTEMK